MTIKFFASETPLGVLIHSFLFFLRTIYFIYLIAESVVQISISVWNWEEFLLIDCNVGNGKYAFDNYHLNNR